MDWGQLLLTALPILLGVGLVWTRIEKILKALVELSEVLVAITTGLEDKNLTKEEVAVIKKEIKEAIQAFKAIVK